MIDACGWKGKSVGEAAVYEKHSLVLVNRGSAIGSEVMTLARALVGADAMLMSVEPGGYDAERDGRLLTPQQAADPLDHPSWYHGFMFSQALTIGGGTFAVQRNIIGERVLSLPRDEDLTLGMSWAEAQRTGSGR
jgi:hypothetical protein